MRGGLLPFPESHSCMDQAPRVAVHGVPTDCIPVVVIPNLLPAFFAPQSEFTWSEAYDICEYYEQRMVCGDWHGGSACCHHEGSQHATFACFPRAFTNPLWSLFSCAADCEQPV